MRCNLSFVLALAATISSVLATPSPQADDAAKQLQALANQAHDKVAQELGGLDRRHSYGKSCNINNVKVRREWNAFSKKERKDYIKAVQCLTSKPYKTPHKLARGARSRFDDFIVTHINQTLAIHYTGNFLAWHRYYTWLYEEALQKECGYKGTQPYWDWGLTALTGLANSPMLDGSPTSMSGNGAPLPDNPQPDLYLTFGDAPPLAFPSGDLDGGGCVKNGPFADLQVNLGPVSLSLPGNKTATSKNPLAYNPRCLKRDLTDSINQDYASYAAIVDNILNYDNIMDFQMVMQSIPGTGILGIHGAGHYAMGGDPGRDVFTSPGDPLFYLHHSMIDRVWWIWQQLDPETRMKGESALAGTNTFLDTPPSANTTVEDFVEYGFAAGPPRRIKELLSTTGGPFCYVYS